MTSQRAPALRAPAKLGEWGLSAAARRLRLALCAALAGLAAMPGAAHRLGVVASADCETMTVQATFPGGRAPAAAEVRLRDGEDRLIATAPLGEDGRVRISLARLDIDGGLVVEVVAGDHADYRILTPEDFARGCPG